LNDIGHIIPAEANLKSCLSVSGQVEGGAETGSQSIPDKWLERFSYSRIIGNALIYYRFPFHSLDRNDSFLMVKPETNVQGYPGSRRPGILDEAGNN